MALITTSFNSLSIEFKLQIFPKFLSSLNFVRHLSYLIPSLLICFKLSYNSMKIIEPFNLMPSSASGKKSITPLFNSVSLKHSSNLLFSKSFILFFS